MSKLFLKKAIKTYAVCALTIGLFMTSNIVIFLALTAYVINNTIKLSQLRLLIGRILRSGQGVAAILYRVKISRDKPEKERGINPLLRGVVAAILYRVKQLIFIQRRNYELKNLLMSACLAQLNSAKPSHSVSHASIK